MMRKLKALVVASMVATATIFLIEPSSGQTAQQEKVCRDFKVDPFQRIRACTAAIEAGGKSMPPKVLAELYAERAIAYSLVSDFERAIADDQKALPFFPHTQNAIDRNNIRLQWLRYLKEIEAMVRPST
jgi:hypothetical protein